MPGPVRADGLFFACAKSKVKSTHKGSTPYVSPERVPAFGWAEKTRMSQPAPTCFFAQTGPLTRPKLCRKTPLHSARSGRACQLAGEGVSSASEIYAGFVVRGHPRVQVSLEHERLSGGAGFFKGRRPLNALLVPFRASEKGPAARGRTPWQHPFGPRPNG